MKDSRRLVAPRATIHVLQEDIDDAIPKNSNRCMIARAIYRAVPTASHVLVDTQSIRWTDRVKKLRYIYLMPRTVQIMVYKWDWGIKPDPFSFQLRGAQIVSARASYSGAKTGEKKTVYHHKLGRAKLSIAPNQIKKLRVKPDIIGGRAPHITRFAHTHRMFGQRSITIHDIFGDAAPEALIEELKAFQRQAEAASNHPRT